jgi:hypothetical protein
LFMITADGRSLARANQRWMKQESHSDLVTIGMSHILDHTFSISFNDIQRFCGP